MTPVKMSRIQRGASSLIHARWFQPLILCIILAAGVLAGLETNPGFVARHGSVLAVVDSAILCIFVIEILLKLAAHGRQPWRFFQSGWNVFDFVIVVVCCLPLGSNFASVFRLARGLRLLRLITALPKLQLLVGALLKSLGAMGYVTLLLAMVFYVYGVAGVHLFGQISPQHFASLPAALLSLFRLITLDNWTDLFLAVVEHNRLLAVVYFVSFILLGTMIMLNLFIGIIMNSMSEMHAELEERARARHLVEDGQASLRDEFNAFDRQLESIREQAKRLRRRLEIQHFASNPADMAQPLGSAEPREPTPAAN